MTEVQHIEFSETAMAEVRRILSHYPAEHQKSAILPVLHLAQKEFGGWLSTDTMDYVARLLHIHPIEVYEVATFYSMYNTKPVGKFLIEFCQTGPCCTVGAEKLIAYLEKKLNIKVGETTSDGMFTLKTVECLGACGYAPMFQIGEQFYEFLNEEKIDKIVEDLRKS
ncbi:MAG: NADH-quinone oxidoreductase subunit NuoE [Chitinophagales bacterium]